MGIEVGSQAPAFSLPSTSGKTLSLAQLKGKKVVLYFYPKDDTPGCTKEACGFRDDIGALKAAGAVIVGVSPDDVFSHEKFIKKYDLPFDLLADTDHAIAEKYGVWKEKSMYGKKYFGIERTTFVIDGKGKIACVFTKVKVDEHSADVLEVLKAIDAHEAP